MTDDRKLILIIQQASAEMDKHRIEMRRLSIKRSGAVAELRKRHPAAWIAEQLGITRQQVHRLLREAHGPSYEAED